MFAFFFLPTKNYIFVAYGNKNVVVALLSKQGQKALGFHQKYVNLCSEDECLMSLKQNEGE